MPIPKTLYQQVRQRAQCRCEYCHYPELLSTAPLSIDHLQSQSLGGTDNFDNSRLHGIVGKNSAGKTSVLQALHNLNKLACASLEKIFKDENSPQFLTTIGEKICLLLATLNPGLKISYSISNTHLTPVAIIKTNLQTS
jgi:ABC-type transport system involved in cytochrome c biogenesis ATPase subunit